ncbi:metallophosphoesterase family protein [Vulcanisaeta distributa]|uniref:Metallophosphoesterase n=1 Tax=Vulcanisaeta distributa (strain DSM 14429 / JCM 11212 / NBRC 100878 / IC-017) TaxID=572478 RepID=E1QSB0_VULDI|nr:metallophosphoesterase family protein [Vulcanisaeta distributa]ADN49503.1 metallophosphoesterase [Vulcanisaeta distributa DSM 14429]
MGVKILHISDVHGNRYYIGSIGGVIKDVDVVVVSGDFEDPEILDVLSNYSRPVYAVMGNMDPYGIRSRVQKYLVEGRIIPIGLFYLAGYPINMEEVKDLGPRLILISHYPPYGTNVDKAWNGSHIGSKSVRRFVENVRPLVVLCGHVHESRGVDRLGNTVIVNPGPLINGYYALVNINDDGTVNAELSKL